MGALFDRLKTWAFEEIVKSADLNAEFDNILNNLLPQKIPSYSANVPQMQVQTNPGELGSESLATSTAGDIERLRYKLAQIMGNQYWYMSPVLSIQDINNLIKVAIGIPNNRLVSGRHRTSSQQPTFLVPDGTIGRVTLKALQPTNPNLSAFIQSSQVLVTADIQFNGLSFAPAVSNTAVINDGSVIGDDASRYTGEIDSANPQLNIGTVGTEIVSRVGQWAAFSVTNLSGTEYFMGYIKNGTTITNVMRGFFFDSLDVPSARIPINNGDTIKLLRLTWVFLKNDAATLDVVYNTPTWSATQPNSPSPGDYWFNMQTQIWMKFDGTQFNNSSSMLVGWCVQDISKCLVSRSLEFFAVYDEINTILPKTQSNDGVMAENQDSTISVFGRIQSYVKSFPSWDMTQDLDVGITRTASTAYYLYVTETGAFKISDVKPYDRTYDFKGKYHPHNTWRCVGIVFNGAGNTLDTTYPAVVKLNKVVNEVPVGAFLPWGGDSSRLPHGYLFANGDAVSRETYADLFGVLGTTYGVGDGSTTFNLPDCRSRAIQGAGNGPGLTPRNRGDYPGGENLPDHVHGMPVGFGRDGGNLTINLYDGTQRASHSGGTNAFFGSVIESTFYRDDGYTAQRTSQTFGSSFGAVGIINPYAVATYIIKY